MRLKLVITFAVLGTMMFSSAMAQQTAQITSSNTAYLQYLPQGYNSNSNRYPVVISLHGIKEKGTTSTNPTDLKASVLKVANVGLPKYIKYGADYPFIMIAPQLKSNMGSWPAAYVLDVINYVKNDLRVDPKRIYITGLSLGGYGAWTTLGAYPDVFAGALPICAGGNALSKACGIADSNVPVWGFHGDSDNVVSYTVTTKMIAAINACTPKPTPLAKATLFAGAGHVIWDKVYKETNALTWMLSYTNGTVTTSNIPPTVDAGVDVVEYLPANAAICNGSASDADGSIAAYAWSQVTGPSAAVLENKTTKSLKASSLTAGTYTFRLKATDDKGAYANDDVKVVINSVTSSLPTVTAGSDKILTLPTNSVYIQGAASDIDGIASYSWTKVYGGSASMSGQTTSKLRAYNLVSGTYVFRLTVKDTKGNAKYDDVTVVVKSSTANAAPVANAGVNKSVTLSTTSLKLYGSAKDSDGTIASYKWTQYAGPASTISYSTSATATVSGLKEGTYYYKLTVKDNDGASDYDHAQVTVSSSTASISFDNSTAGSLIATAE
ncbi:MAG: PHB depolymerase family esterase [Cyclobacteriaceae bacterium]